MACLLTHHTAVGQYLCSLDMRGRNAGALEQAPHVVHRVAVEAPSGPGHVKAITLSSNRLSHAMQVHREGRVLATLPGRFLTSGAFKRTTAVILLHELHAALEDLQWQPMHVSLLWLQCVPCMVAWI